MLQTGFSIASSAIREMLRSPSKESHAGLRAEIAGWLLPCLIVLLTVLVYLPTLQNGFVNWDDDKFLLDNPYYRGLSWTELRWMFSTAHWGHYFPLAWMTLGLDYLLWGMNPRGYHLTNFLIHSANAGLFYF